MRLNGREVTCLPLQASSNVTLPLPVCGILRMGLLQLRRSPATWLSLGGLLAAETGMKSLIMPHSTELCCPKLN
jgi:hypothetical protein